MDEDSTSQVDLADARGEEGDDPGEDGADGVPLAHRAPVHDHGEALLLGARHHGQVVLKQQVLRGEGESSVRISQFG